MGKQTCSVLVAFVAVHVALVLMIISVATPEWLVGDVPANSTEHNTTYSNTTGNVSIPTNYTRVNKGLFKICFDGGHFDNECYNINSFDNVEQSDWFKASVVLAILGTLGTLVCACMYYGFLLVTRLRTSAKYFYLLLAIQVVAVLEFTATVVLFGIRNTEQVNNPLMSGETLDLELGWSYYVATAGAVAAWISVIGSMREVCLLNQDQAPYENL